MLPEAVVEFLAKSVSDFLVATSSHDTHQNQRRYSAVSGNEIWLWIAQRLDISLHVKKPIMAAYNDV
jgi:hypothetical protein